MTDSDIRTYRATSIHQALQMVEEELGRDAVILHVSGKQLHGHDTHYFAFVINNWATTAALSLFQPPDVEPFNTLIDNRSHILGPRLMNTGVGGARRRREP